mgnify:CR=1 FL=1
MGARLTVSLVAGTALLAMLGLALWDRDRLIDRLALAQSNVKTLQGAVEAQNAAIREWQTKADVFEAQAAIRARAALQRRPALPTGHGPEAMNAWLRETFGRADAP